MAALSNPMTSSWRIKLRSAEQAYSAGRLEEAAQLLTDRKLQILPAAHSLIEQVGGKILTQAQAAITQHNPAAAARGLKLAQLLLGNTPRMQAAHQSLAASVASQAAAPSAVGQRPTGRAVAWSSRFLLWIDAVGGYLVCRQKEVVLGQPGRGDAVDIGLVGDVARQHAKIRRDGEEYLLEPLAETRLQGKSLEKVALLRHGNEFELGQVRLRFSKPHALSASARLDFVGPRRTQPKVDAILLMAESCVLGPHLSNHVVCRDWEEDLVIFQQGADVYARCQAAFAIDGEPCEGKGKLPPAAHVTADDLSFSIEPLEV